MKTSTHLYFCQDDENEYYESAASLAHDDPNASDHEAGDGDGTNQYEPTSDDYAANEFTVNEYDSAGEEAGAVNGAAAVEGAAAVGDSAPAASNAVAEITDSDEEVQQQVQQPTEGVQEPEADTQYVCFILFSLHNQYLYIIYPRMKQRFIHDVCVIIQLLINTHAQEHNRTNVCPKHIVWFTIVSLDPRPSRDYNLIALIDGRDTHLPAYLDRRRQFRRHRQTKKLERCALHGDFNAWGASEHTGLGVNAMHGGSVQWTGVNAMHGGSVQWTGVQCNARGVRSMHEGSI